MLNKKTFLQLFLWFVILVIFAIGSSSFAEGLVEEGDVRASGPVVRKEERRTVVSTEYGEISAVRISQYINGSYLLHFFTLEPNALFLPVVLHADMVFYVHTGSGQLSWADEEDDLKHSYLRRGDVFRLEQGTVFYIQTYSQYESDPKRLRIHAIFTNSNDDLRVQEPTMGPYSSIQDTVRGFGRRVLQSTFQVPEEVIDELLAGTRPPLIVHAGTEWGMEIHSTEGRTYNILDLNKKKKKDKRKGGKEKEEKGNAKLFNLFKEEKDIENCNGWSTMVTRNKLSALKGSGIGSFMVNLTIGSMMAPHWNPMSNEISIVLQGRGMVRALCSSLSNDQTTCRDTRYEVEQGDVFVVPQFTPVAQMSFNNDTFVFMGFSTSTKRNYPRFLGGEYSVLRALGKKILATSFNVTGATMDRLLSPKDESVIVGCISCAEEELMIMEEEMEPEEEKHGGGGGSEEEEGQGGENYGYEEWTKRIPKRKRLTV